MRVLIVDDNDLVLDLLSRRLNSRGYEVFTANNGANGVEVAQSTSPHVILMDLTLPEIDGCEATRRIRKSKATHNIPVVALTGYDDSEHRSLAVEAGCTSFIEKPINFEALFRTIEVLGAGALAS